MTLSVYFAVPGQANVKPRLTVKNAGSASQQRPDWATPQPGTGSGPAIAKLGSTPPSKQQKGLKKKANKEAQLPPRGPGTNGLYTPQDQPSTTAQRPKLKVKQALKSSQPVPSETGGSELSLSALTEDDASNQAQQPLGATSLSNAAAAEQQPDIPVTRQDLLRVVDRVQQKDWYEIFKEPVTDDVVSFMTFNCHQSFVEQIMPCSMNVLNSACKIDQ